MGVGFYIALMVGAGVWVGTAIINETYLRRAHAVRAVINVLCFVFMMIMMLLQSINVISLSQNLTPGLIGLVVLSATFFFNVAVFVKI
jgi:protein gp37